MKESELGTMAESKSPKTSKAFGKILDVVTLERAGYDTHFLTVQPALPSEPGAMFECVADVLAVAPKTDAVRIKMVDSPLQGAAWAYGSSFSRALEVIVPDCRRLYISGSASITPDGATADLKLHGFSLLPPRHSESGGYRRTRHSEIGTKPDQTGAAKKFHAKKQKRRLTARSKEE